MPITNYSETLVRKTPYSLRWKYAVNGKTFTYYDMRGQRTISTEQKAGRRDTDWKVKIAKRQDASGAYSRLFWPYVLPGYHDALLACKSWNISTQRFDVLSDTVDSFDISTTNQAGLGTTDTVLRDQALASFKKKLSGKIGGAELLVPTAELKEMRGMITQFSTVTQKTLAAVAELVFSKNGRLFVKHLQDVWLGYSFGVAPMVNDIKSAIDAMGNYFDRPVAIHKVHGTARKRWVNSSKTIGEGRSGWAVHTATTTVNHLSYTYSAGIDYKLITGNNYGIMDHLGFDDFWGKLPSVGWELLPFSWVADYFTTIGAYLDDTFVLPPGSTKYLTLTRVYTSELRETIAMMRSATPAQFSHHEKLYERCIPALAKLVSMDRSIVTALPHRSLRFKTVDEVGKTGVKKLLNLTALLNFEAEKVLLKSEWRPARESWRAR